VSVTVLSRVGEEEPELLDSGVSVGVTVTLSRV
jgi:hypothetical protein